MSTNYVRAFMMRSIPAEETSIVKIVQSSIRAKKAIVHETQIYIVF